MATFFLVFFMEKGQAQLDSASSRPADRPAIRYNLNEDGSRFIQFVFTNQVWMRYSELNAGSTRFGRSTAESFDIGLRRTRMQLFGQITSRAFLYFQFGQNNFNSAYNYTGNRKVAAFFHDAVGEYRVTKGNGLKLGAGLTIMNGLSRFSQPAIGSIMTLDVPVFLQYSVDQVDQFDRRLAVYARGQVKRVDYRVYVADPFPISSNGATPPSLSANANFVNVAALAPGTGPGIKNQVGGYFAFNFFENENHLTPYLQGTYLGTKKVWNVAIGFVRQNNAMWHLEQTDTVYSPMVHLSLESYLDIPLNKENGTCLSAFAGFYDLDYGHHYLRFNGLMNPATGVMPGYTNPAGSAGNAFPMFGTGHVTYAQAGYLFRRNLLGKNAGTLMPFASAQFAEMPALQYKQMLVYDIGVNWLMSGHNSKLSLDFQTRPTYLFSGNSVTRAKDKRSVILQYQVSF